RYPGLRPAMRPQISTRETLTTLAGLADSPFEDARAMPPEIYTSDDILALEKEQIFATDWVCAGLANEIPSHGDYITFSIADQPVFVPRDGNGDIRSFANVCRHRMMELLEGRGNKKRIVCPYHAWTYNLDGQLIGAQHMEHSNAFKKKEICLPEVRTEIWEGWIYLSLNPDALPLAKTLAPLGKIVARYRMADYIPVVNEDHVWQTNWKLLTENFMEGYHLPVAHKATVGAWFPAEETKFPKNAPKGFTYQSFVKDEIATYGQAHPKNKRLKGKWRNTSLLPTVFPSHMYVLAPDHLWYLSLRPDGVGQTKVRFGVALAPEVHDSLEDVDAFVREMVDFFVKVNAEDRYVVEGIFRGARAPYTQPGPLSWLERELHDFMKYLASRLPAGSGSATLRQAAE
ncbi:MAG: aromatic ring-hydroxylating oxygenase subunit alpha, partial [Hyphomicrobiaceae bacterium]